jgi:hypothetical protein
VRQKRRPGPGDECLKSVVRVEAAVRGGRIEHYQGPISLSPPKAVDQSFADLAAIIAFVWVCGEAPTDEGSSRLGRFRSLGVDKLVYRLGEGVGVPSGGDARFAHA